MKWIFLIGLIVLIVLLSGCNVTTWPPTDVSQCKTYGELKGDFGHNKTECYTLFAIQNNDPDICINDDLLLSGPCLKQFAIEKNDSSVCGKIPPLQFESNFVEAKTSKDLCYLGTKKCQLIEAEDLKEECYALYDKSGCYEIQNLNQRAECFGEYLISGLAISLEAAYNNNNCEEKINDLVNNGVIYKRDFVSNPRAYDELPLDNCVVIKAVIDTDPKKCEILKEAGQGVVDYCYARLSEYYQMNYCESLAPSCSYDGDDLFIDSGIVNPNAFGKEYCKAISQKYKDSDQPKHILMTDLSLCNIEQTIPIESEDETEPTESNNELGEFSWKKFILNTSSPASCLELCDAEKQCKGSSDNDLLYCRKTLTVFGFAEEFLMEFCSGGTVNEKDFDSFYCCCPN